MKLKIKAINKKPVSTQYGEKESLRFLNELDGKWYSSFWNSTVGSWTVGQTVETQVEQKGAYWNIVTPKEKTQHPLSSNSQLDRIEKKIDFLIRSQGLDAAKMMSDTERQELGIPELPYEDSPPPKDSDFPGY